MRLLTHLLASSLLALGLWGCGGGSTGESKTAGDSSHSSSDDGGGWGDGDGDESGPSGPDCSDGTCFACGDGICPSGAYCDQGAEGGAACAWLPECSGTPSCGCITGVLSGCTCEDSSGGPVVSCP
jgi:hypothetical protein